MSTTDTTITVDLKWCVAKTMVPFLSNGRHHYFKTVLKRNHSSYFVYVNFHSFFDITNGIWYTAKLSARVRSRIDFFVDPFDHMEIHKKDCSARFLTDEQFEKEFLDLLLLDEDKYYELML